MRCLLFRFQNVAVTAEKPGFALIFLATVLDKFLQEDLFGKNTGYVLFKIWFGACGFVHDDSFLC